LCIPKKSVESDFFHGHERQLGLLYLLHGINRNSRTFTYFPENKYKGISYGPNFVFANSYISGFYSKKSPKINLEVSVETAKLADNGIAAVIMEGKKYDNPGIFIGVDPSKDFEYEEIFEPILKNFLNAIIKKDNKTAYSFLSNTAKNIINFELFGNIWGEILEKKILTKFKKINFKTIWIHSNHFVINNEWIKLRLGYSFGTIYFINGKQKNFVCWYEKDDTHWLIHKFML